MRPRQRGQNLDTDPNAFMLSDPRRALAGAGILLAGGIVVCLLVWSTALRAHVQAVDDRFLQWMIDIRNPVFSALAKTLSFVGGTFVTWPVRVAVVVVLLRRRHWVHLAAFAVAVVTSELMINVLKALYDRPRPPNGLITTNSSSFPSGHAVAGAVTAVGIVIALLPPGHTRWKWERRAALYAFFMALGRTYLGVHWLSDVVAGALLGSALALGCPALFVLGRTRVLARRERASP